MQPENEKDFWPGKRVLVTGADGFIGSHLVEALIGMGAIVTAFVHYNSFDDVGWLDSISDARSSRLKIFPGDVRDADRVREAMEGNEVVFHLASLIAIPYSYHAPSSYVNTNVVGTLNVLTACRDLGIARVVHTSTSEVYGTARYVPIDESHPLQGQSPYSATKIAADMLAESFFRSYDVPVVTIRPFNTYGPRQSARAVIPTIISQLLDGANELKLGSLSPTRDMNYVADTVRGFMLGACSPGAIGRVINIGSGREISIGDLAQMLIDLVGREVRIVCDEERLRPQKSEVNRLLCNAALAKELLGWEAKYTLEEGLKKTIEWISENRSAYRSNRYTI